MVAKKTPRLGPMHRTRRLLTQDEYSFSSQLHTCDKNLRHFRIVSPSAAIELSSFEHGDGVRFLLRRYPDDPESWFVELQPIDKGVPFPSYCLCIRTVSREELGMRAPEKCRNTTKRRKP
jgi:hypothetical protein